MDQRLTGSSPKRSEACRELAGSWLRLSEACRELVRSLLREIRCLPEWWQGVHQKKAKRLVGRSSRVVEKLVGI
ncbi:hypothetical protein BHE74_00008093 [Ensete ventricosum]|nr:hypothetical protein BHE74_00008093 [Ensete ventricosum]